MVAIVIAMVPISGCAENPNPVEKMRHEKFEELGRAFKSVHDESKKETPDFNVVRDNANRIDQLAQEQLSWFPSGSGPEAGVKTKAKAEIWTHMDDFRVQVQQLQTQTAALKEVAGSDDPKKLAAQVEVTGKACSACHDKFRKSGLLSLFGG
jgi:cytochrome c556